MLHNSCSHICTLACRYTCRPPVMPAATASLASLQLQLQLSSKAAQQEWELAKSSSSSSAGSPTLVPMHPPLNQQQQHRQADATQLGVAVAPSLLPPQEVGWRQQWDIARGPLVKGALSAPVIAGILAIMIGSCPPLQVSIIYGGVCSCCCCFLYVCMCPGCCSRVLLGSDACSHMTA